jgi:hypothetical protein
LLTYQIKRSRLPLHASILAAVACTLTLLLLLPWQVNWEEEHQSTFVHLPGHDIEEGVAQNGNGSSNTGGALPLLAWL